MSDHAPGRGGLAGTGDQGERDADRRVSGSTPSAGTYGALAAWCVRRHALLLALILVLASTLRAPFVLRRHYHTDEYRTLHRALVILDGDPFLATEPSQKPPLFYALLAGLFAVTGASDTAAVMTNLTLSLASIVVVDAIARSLYGDPVLALLASWFVATSLFHVLFSPTIFLDPSMLLLALLAWLAALRARPLASGVLGALSMAAKQQGLILLPLAAASLPLGRSARGGLPPPPGRGAVRWAVGLLGGCATLVLWGLGTRASPLHFVSGQIANEESAIGGSLVVNPFVQGFGALTERLWGWWRFEEILLANGWITALSVIGLSLVLARGLYRTVRSGRLGKGVAADSLVLCALLGLAVLLAVVRFRYVDRYVLPLVPLLALALARTLAAGLQGAVAAGRRSSLRVVALGAMALVMGAPLWAYANARDRAMVEGRRVGVFHDTRADLKPFLESLAESLGPRDEIYCDFFTQPAAAFLLRPRRVLAVTEESLRRLDATTGHETARARGRVMLVWSTALPLEPLRQRLASRWVLVPIATSASGIRAFRLDPAEGS